MGVDGVAGVALNGSKAAGACCAFLASFRMAAGVDGVAGVALNGSRAAGVVFLTVGRGAFVGGVDVSGGGFSIHYYKRPRPAAGRTFKLCAM